MDIEKLAQALLDRNSVYEAFTFPSEKESFAFPLGNCALEAAKPDTTHVTIDYVAFTEDAGTPPVTLDKLAHDFVDPDLDCRGEA